MKSPAPKLARCAVYTRKSTEHNLDLAFNSLDAQREACEAYIKSQAHEGWRLIPDRYDDGAFSGASLDRPALKRLLAEVRAGKIDIVVVYKVDRLTRSLSDFAKLVELFDQHAVSFVSVTQSFNTTSSMGRLTLNVLLSFAQFEREVIGERVRDKIAASKKKGIWVGGPIPLGYRSINKKIVIVPEEAETVRTIFQRYLDLGSIGALVQELERRGIRTKRRVLANGRVRGGCRFGIGAMAYMLKNRFFIGEIAYRGEIHRGEHEPILDRALFDAVQTKLASRAIDRELRLKGSSAILMGRIFDDRGNRMTPSHSNKRGVRYRYYISHPVLQQRKGDAGSVVRVSAPDIEIAVVTALRENLKNTGKPECSTSIDDRDLVERHVQRVIIKPKTIELRLIVLANAAEQTGNRGISVTDQRSNDPQSFAITIPWAAPSFIATKGILHAPSSHPSMKPETRDALLVAIAKARSWIDDLIEGRAASLTEIAEREGKGERHVRNLAQLAFVSSHITEAIIDSSAPHNLTVTELAKALPYSWAEQERRIGLASSRV
jgi:DNA invertase Pin-like site-specific DNA recombinase